MTTDNNLNDLNALIERITTASHNGDFSEWTENSEKRIGFFIQMQRKKLVLTTQGKSANVKENRAYQVLRIMMQEKVLGKAVLLFEKINNSSWEITNVIESIGHAEGFINELLPAHYTWEDLCKLDSLKSIGEEIICSQNGASGNDIIALLDGTFEGFQKMLQNGWEFQYLKAVGNESVKRAAIEYKILKAPGHENSATTIWLYLSQTDNHQWNPYAFGLYPSLSKLLE
jgi:hypothetical protein